MNSIVAVTRMEPSCSQVISNHNKDGYNHIPNNNIEENKTDREASNIGDNPDQHELEIINGIERESFEEENWIVKHCSGVIVDGSKLSGKASLSESFCSANSTLSSSSKTISDLNDDYTKPGCSRTEDDSNSTIKKMMQSKTISYSSCIVDTIENENKVVLKDDFMKKLLSSGPREPEDYPKGKLYIEDVKTCDEIDQGKESRVYGSGSSRSTSSSSSNSTSSACKESFNMPSTSNAEKLLGFNEEAQSNTSQGSPNFKSFYCEEDDSEEDMNDINDCTCTSWHEEEDDSDMTDSNEDRSWRKRRYEPPSVVTSPIAKKFCSDDNTIGNGDGEWATNSMSTTSYSPEIRTWITKFHSWSNSEKIQALDALITHCAASQVRHMMKAIEPLFQRDFIYLLPKELALTVLGYLQPKDLLRAAQTCRYWRFLADDNLLWKEKCRRIGITTFKKTPRSLPRCASPWKAAYMRQYLIENNWLHKPVHEPIVMRGHDDHVITCLQFYGNRILSGSDDTTLKIWSAITGKCLRTLVGHSGGVWSSQMVGDLVISGSTDRTLRVWDALTGKCLNVLSGHTSTVRCMHLHQDRVVSGSRDATLRVWSISEGKCLRVLVGHLAAVRCVQFDGKVVVSGAYDYFVKVWNPETGECIHTLGGHTNRVYSLQFDGVHVVSGSLDTSIRVWDVESGQLKHTLIGHQSLTSGMELHSNILVSGNADSTVKVWDISTGHCLHTLSGPFKHQSAVTCLQSSNRFVITSSDDGTVKLWDVHTGEFIRNLVELGSGGAGGVVWRIRASSTKLICAVGSRNGTEETKLLVLDFDVPGACRKCEE